MFRLIKRLFQIALVAAIVALVFDFKYQGKSSRDYAWEYGEKGLRKMYEWGKSLSGKDVEELAPRFLPKLREKISPSNPPEKKSENAKKEARPKASPTPKEGIEEQDREKLKTLVEEKKEN